MNNDSENVISQDQERIPILESKNNVLQNNENIQQDTVETSNNVNIDCGLIFDKHNDYDLLFEKNENYNHGIQELILILLYMPLFFIIINYLFTTHDREYLVSKKSIRGRNTTFKFLIETQKPTLVYVLLSLLLLYITYILSYKGNRILALLLFLLMTFFSVIVLSVTMYLTLLSIVDISPTIMSNNAKAKISYSIL